MEDGIQTCQMRAEDFDTASIKELQDMADRCFKMAQSPLDEPRINSLTGALQYSVLDDAAKLRLLLEAQFYLTAVARKRDEEVANRDRRLEIWVIVLIGIEILLSVIGIGLGIYEGTQQAEVLANIEQGTNASASAMTAARDSLQNLATSQTQSLNHLKQMDSNLQSSQKMSEAMVSATRKQLNILAQEQADRTAQLAKKPNLVIHFGDVGPPLNTFVRYTIRPRNETDTGMTVDFTLANEGDAIATRPVLRIVAPAVVTVVSAHGLEGPIEPSPGSDDHIFLLNFGNLRPKVRVPLSLTFNYPPDTRLFHIEFFADTDELGAATLLGGLDFVPARFQSRCMVYLWAQLFAPLVIDENLGAHNISPTFFRCVPQLLSQLFDVPIHDLPKRHGWTRSSKTFQGHVQRFV